MVSAPVGAGATNSAWSGPGVTACAPGRLTGCRAGTCWPLITTPGSVAAGTTTGRCTGWAGESDGVTAEGTSRPEVGGAVAPAGVCSTGVANSDWADDGGVASGLGSDARPGTTLSAVGAIPVVGGTTASTADTPVGGTVLNGCEATGALPAETSSVAGISLIVTWPPMTGGVFAIGVIVTGPSFIPYTVTAPVLRSVTMYGRPCAVTVPVGARSTGRTLEGPGPGDPAGPSGGVQLGWEVPDPGGAGVLPRNVRPVPPGPPAWKPKLVAGACPVPGTVNHPVPLVGLSPGRNTT